VDKFNQIWSALDHNGTGYVTRKQYTSWLEKNSANPNVKNLAKKVKLNFSHTIFLKKSDINTACPNLIRWNIGTTEISLYVIFLVFPF
jgi:hypothetical protein